MMNISSWLLDGAKEVGRSAISQMYDLGSSLTSSIAGSAGKVIYSIKDMIWDRGLCYMCKSSQIIDIPCKHCLCRFCLVRYISIMTENQDCDFVPCFICKFPISVNIDEINANEECKDPEEDKSYNIDSSENSNCIDAKSEEVRCQNRSSSISRPPPMFLCEIDGEQHSMDDAFTLECDHRFCRSCIEQYITIKIDSNELREDQLACPLCNNPITVNEVFGAVPYNKYMLYINIKDRTAIVDGHPVKQCPYCEILISIPANLKKIVCPNPHCKKTYCPQCNKNYHPGKSCQEMNKVEEEIPGIAKCPKCGEGYFKDDGCNFMTCRRTCQNFTCFCFLCGKKLSRSQHYSHFQKGGPFGQSCNTLDGIKE
ncbi:unnamed protein product [Blepharisma stoltei]|uniref:RBR-type E3 ubiquitin transferase n=1 Tax=Blepharisma stoltei TaxID=1481888 RepID=A0AAU9JEU8_9CILI|nr:unnamed protein product [Blepharisma stoltei]